MKVLDNPKYIFKFQSCGKFLNQSLENNTIYFSSIEDFNDPFETMFTIRSWNNDEKEEDYFYSRIFPHTALARIKKKEHDRIIKSRRESPGNEMLLNEDLTNSILAGIRDLFGIACFSHSYSELLMWSHYANVGKGVCLIFDKEELFSESQFGFPKIMRVNYPDRLPEIDVRLSEERIQFNIETLLTTKRNNWSYEKEVRAFIYMGGITPEISMSSALLNGKDRNLRNLSFSPEAFKGIIFGHNCSTRNKNKIKGILKMNDKLDFNSLVFAEATVNNRSGQYYFREEQH